MKKMILPLLAIVIAIAGSAFTTIQKSANATGDLVWFLVDPNTGEAQDPDHGGVQRDEAPSVCSEGNKFCATALSISQGDVVMNGTGYAIQLGVDITDPADYDAIAFEP